MHPATSARMLQLLWFNTTVAASCSAGCGLIGTFQIASCILSVLQRTQPFALFQARRFPHPQYKGTANLALFVKSGADRFYPPNLGSSVSLRSRTLCHRCRAGYVRS